MTTSQRKTISMVESSDRKHLFSQGSKEAFEGLVQQAEFCNFRYFNSIFRLISSIWYINCSQYLYVRFQKKERARAFGSVGNEKLVMNEGAS